MRSDGGRNIDWAGVKARLAAAERALESFQAADLDERAEALRRRSEALAAVGAREAGSPTRDVLEVSVGAERLAVEARDVQEVVRLPKLVPVPRAPEEILGVLQLHGEIRPALDLARLVEMGPSGEPPRYGLVIRRGGVELVLAVTAIASLRSLPPGAETAEGTGRYSKQKLDDGVPVLDLEALLSHPLMREAFAPWT